MHATVTFVLAAAVLATTSCGDSGADPVERYLSADQRLFEAVCECNDGPAQHCEVEAVDDCDRGVLREHGEVLEPWLECAAAHRESQERCFLDAGCTPSGRACIEPPAVTPCAEHDRLAVEAALADALVSCPKNIRCEDRTTTRGNYCNGEPECVDGSDEASCSPRPSVVICGDGLRITVSFICDGVDDCEGGQDEACSGLTPGTA